MGLGEGPHHSVAFHSGQLEGGEALVIEHEVQGLQVVPLPVVGQQQVVHLAGKGFVGLEDEDVQHCVSWERTRGEEPQRIMSLRKPHQPPGRCLQHCPT